MSIANKSLISTLRRALWMVAAASLDLIATAALADKDKMALVIGNDNYVHAPHLNNSRFDAQAVAEELKTKLGFTVVEGYDVDETALREKIGEFVDNVVEAKVALVYYAGHGVSFDNENYLLPVNIELKRTADLDLHALTVASILKQLGAEDRINIVILDACRDNPFPRDLGKGSRAMPTRGLAPIDRETARGKLIAFSTDPGSSALDGHPGEHSPFAQALLDHLEDPDVDIDSMMKRVRIEVDSKTHGAQMPWVNSALLGEFEFNPSRANASQAAVAAPPQQPPLAPAQAAVPPAQPSAPAAQAAPALAANPAVQPSAPAAPPMAASAPAAPAAPAAAATPLAPSNQKSPPAPPAQAAVPPAPPNAPVTAATVVASLEAPAAPPAPGVTSSDVGGPDTEKQLTLTPVEVRKLQAHLQFLRLYHGPLDGNIENGVTRDAILEWQKLTHLQPTSYLSANQLATLLALTPAKPGTADLLKEIGNVDTQSALLLSIDEVKEVQLRLAAAGYLKVAPSGKFDPPTKEAISRFQHDEGCASTGSLGPLQLQELFAMTESRYEESLANGPGGAPPVAATSRSTGAVRAVQHHYHNTVNNNGAANAFGLIVHGLAIGVGAAIGSRIH